MYAIIETGGKQYKVQPGDIIDIERIDPNVDQEICFENVLAIADGAKLKLGKPTIKGASVSASLVKDFRAKKIVVFKMKRRKGYRRKSGHRQSLSRVEIQAIENP